MRRYLLLLVALFLAICGHSQPAGDTAMIKKEKDAFAHSDADPDSSLLIARDGIRQSQRSRDDRLAAYAYKTLGWAFFHQGNYDSCFAGLLTAIRLFTKILDTLETTYLFTRLALAYSNHSQFVESAVYLVKADPLAKLDNNTKIQSAIKRQMGILYRQQGDYRNAVAYHLQVKMHK